MAVVTPHGRTALARPYVTPSAGTAIVVRRATPASVRAAPPFAPDVALAQWTRDLVRRSANGRPPRRNGAASRRIVPGSLTSYEEWAGGGAVRVPAGLRSVAPVPRNVATDGTSDGATDSRARAADHLESIARRVRSGQLRPLGLTPSMTEAGALAATLAALLAAGA